MAGRPVDVRLRVDGWLRTLSPLRVGGLGHRAVADDDLAVALDGQARPYVPATSLAGACRAWMSGTPGVDDRRLDHLWGFAEATAGAGAASRVFVDDGVICLAPDETSPFPTDRLGVRSSAEVDRRTGAVARTRVWSLAVVPAGAFVRLGLVVESSADQAALDGARLAALLRAMQAGEVSLGAASRSGLGRVELLDPVDVVEDDLASKSGLLDVLRGSPRRRRTLDELTVDPGLVGRSSTRVTIAWTPLAPVAVRADRAGVVPDTMPRTTVDADGALRLVVPGSTLLGAWRAHAERILRTVHDVPAGDVPAGGSDPLALAKALFGAPAGSGPDTAAGNAAGAGTGAVTGALRASDCLSTHVLDPDLWERVGAASEIDAGDRAQLAGYGLELVEQAPVDRWTGAAASARSFTVVEPWNVDWRPIVVDVDLARLSRASVGDDGDDGDGDGDGSFADRALALFFLVLRDFAAGRVPLGHSSHRGFGDLRARVVLDGPDTDGSTELDRYLVSVRGRALAAAWATEGASRKARARG